MLFSESVETLKTQYTDKYVRVNAALPELARFQDAVGQVKTVNMNGRALVEFMDYHLNTGWFDIDPSCLTVVEKPAPKEATEKVAKPQAAEAKPAAAKPQAMADAGAKKLSPLEMARMQGAGGKAAGAAAAKPASDAAAPAKKSTADILAAARGKTAVPATPAPKAPPAAPPAPTPEAVVPAPAASAGGVVKVDRSSMSVADMIAYCRATDGK